MFAVAWPWGSGVADRDATLAMRLGSSLCAGIGGHAGTAISNGIHFAYRSLRSTQAQARAWRPTVLPNGQIAIFHGYFDNALAIAAELKTNPHDLAQLYGLAVEAWNEEADLRIIGEYCAAIAHPITRRLRLSRSPLRAPPLYYAQEDHLVTASSVPRALFAAGIGQRLNEIHIADSSLFNYADEEASFFENIARIPLGAVVDIERGNKRLLRKYYNVIHIPEQPATGDSEVIDRVGNLLDEGVRVCLAGFARPGATLSGGLDSPQVAVRALNAIPASQKLPTFTFHPEAAWDRREPPRMTGDERPFVEAFAAMHPRLEPHFTSNEGYEHDYRWNDFFHLMGAAPAGFNTLYVFHGLLSDAAREGCDMLLLAEWGNLTFSDRGESGFVEYFLKGKWRQLWLALRRPPIHHGSIMRRVLACTFSAFLPDSLWRSFRKLLLRKNRLASELIQPLSPTYRRKSGANERLKASGRLIDRYQPWSRRHSRHMITESGDWISDAYQAFEQMYGIALRDPTAYRPFVEYCLGLPTHMFMRDGEIRWLAKQMAKGMMPEEQRKNSLGGWWDADWHLRIGRRREDFLAELDCLEDHDRLGEMLDISRLRSALNDWPERTETDPQKFFGIQLAIPAALLTARFVKYVEGKND